MFEIVYDGRTTDGRRLDGYPISSPCEPNGSGELKKMYTPVNPFCYIKVGYLHDVGKKAGYGHFAQ